MKQAMIDRCKPEHRDLLAFVLKHNRGARKMFAHLVRMNAQNIRPDYMLFRGRDGTYHRCTDPGAWMCRAQGMHIALIRHSDGEWLLHS